MEKMDFHIHSDYSDDGTASLEDIIAEALRWGFVAIGIVDHMRGTADWLGERERSIADLRKKYGADIDIFSGIEVRVVDERGALDIDDAAIDAVDYVVGSFHGMPERVAKQTANGDDKALIRWWCDSLQKLLEGGQRAQVIGHPDRILAARNLSVDSERLGRLLDAAIGSTMFLEWNPATTYPVQPFVQELGDRDACNLTYASDAHSIEELSEAYRGFTSFEAGIVECGNASLLALLKDRQAKRL